MVTASFMKKLKEKFFKSNHENMMKSNGGIPSHHVSEKEGTGFWGDSLNKNIPRK